MTAIPMLLPCDVDLCVIVNALGMFFPLRSYILCKQENYKSFLISEHSPFFLWCSVEAEWGLSIKDSALIRDCAIQAKRLWPKAVAEHGEMSRRT